MFEQILANGQMIATVVMVLVCVNIALSAAKQILEKIKDKTASNADNKAYEIISKVSDVLAKVVDWFSANISHK